ncbi:MAG TPA: helix-turn-helix transcriptional regulator [Clostridiales bacterium]|nr:helix-turn-helix transcriptional regulator [Clostridiales bacterium]
MVTIGERIRELRKANKWTQQELAEKLGLDRTTISKWERQGGSEPDNLTITKLADIFDVSTDYLLGKSDFRRPLPQTVAPYLPEGFDKLSPEARKEVMDFIEYVRVKYAKKDGDDKK